MEFIGFIKVEPVYGIKEELTEDNRPSDQPKKPSERIKDLGGKLDEEAASLVDKFEDVFEDLPPMGVVERPVQASD